MTDIEDHMASLLSTAQSFTASAVDDKAQVSESAMRASVNKVWLQCCQRLGAVQPRNPCAYDWPARFCRPQHLIPLLRTHSRCVQEGLPWEQVERLNILATAQRALPQPPAASLLTRNVLEELAPSHAAHAIAAASHAYPRTTTHTLQPSGDRVIVCYGSNASVGEATAAPAAALAAYVPFSEYVETALASAGAVAPADLPLCVHAVSRKAFVSAAQVHTATVSESVWLRASAQAFSALSTDGASATFVPGVAAHVAVHGAYGLHVRVERCQAPSQTIAEAGNAREGFESRDAVGDTPALGDDAQSSGSQVRVGVGMWLVRRQRTVHLQYIIVCRRSLLGDACTSAKRLCMRASNQTCQLHLQGCKVSACTPAGCQVSLDTSGTFIFRDSAGVGWRAALPDGTWISSSSVGHVTAWHADGSKLESSTGDGGPEVSGPAIISWLATAPDGSRSKLPGAAHSCSQPATEQPATPAVTDAPPQDDGAAAGHPPIDEASAGGEAAPALLAAEFSTAVDPDMGARVDTRADLSQRIEYLTGDVLELRPDGSRLTLFADGEWLLEAPDTPVLRGGPERVACALQPGVLLEWRAGSGEVVLRQEDGPVVVCRNATVCCGATLLSNLHAAIHAWACLR